MQKVIAKCADGVSRELAFVDRVGRTVLLCSIERYRKSEPDKRHEYAVGFPEDDVTFEEPTARRAH